MLARSSTRRSSIEAATGSLAANVQIWRAKAGLTQEAAAEAAGLSEVYWKQLERGTAANPSLAILVNVAAALDTEPAELLRYRPAPEPRRPGRPRAGGVVVVTKRADGAVVIAATGDPAQKKRGSRTRRARH